MGFAEELSVLPIRADFPYVEPSAYDEVLKELDPGRPRGQFRAIGEADAKERVQAAFLGSVCGCMLGKPLEVHPTMAELERSDDPRRCLWLRLPRQPRASG